MPTKSLIEQYLRLRLISTSFVQQAYSPEEWELATLVLTRPSYQIKFKHTGEVIFDEKYSPNLQVYFPSFHVTLAILELWIYSNYLIHSTCLFDCPLFNLPSQTKIPNGRTTQFVLVSSTGANLPFNTQGLSEPNNEDHDVRYCHCFFLSMLSGKFSFSFCKENKKHISDLSNSDVGYVT